MHVLKTRARKVVDRLTHRYVRLVALADDVTVGAEVHASRGTLVLVVVVVAKAAAAAAGARSLPTVVLVPSVTATQPLHVIEGTL